MDEVNLAAVDMNLLVALEALLDEQHVTRAAQRLGLSQPATSNALSRLRALFDDPLLVRVGSSMRRTPRADDLRPRVQAVLSGARELLVARTDFVPRAATGTITIAISDYVGLVLVPHLVALVAEAAPQLTLRFVAHSNVLDTTALADGTPRVSLGFFFDSSPSLRAQTLFSERFACLVRPGDLPGRLTRRRYLALSHVLVSQRGATEGYIDRALAEAGDTREIRTVLPHFLAAGAVVAASGGVVTLPARVAALTAQRLELELHDLPLPHPSWPLVMVWHERFDLHDESAWLRAQIAAVAEAL